MRDVVELGERQRGDPEAALGSLGDDQVVTGEAVECLAQRAHADIIMQAQGFEPQLAARGQLPRHDVAAEALMGVIGKRLGNAAGCGGR